MSIKAIESQMMAARAPDLIKENSTLQKRDEIVQTQLAFQAKTEREEEQKAVPVEIETDTARLRPDDDTRKGAAGGSKGRRNHKDAANKDDEDDSELVPGNIVPKANHLIDITV